MNRVPLVSLSRAVQILRMATVQEIETELLRRMTPSAKLAVMHTLWQQAWDLKAAGLRRQHPTWTPDEINARVREIFRGADS